MYYYQNLSIENISDEIDGIIYNEQWADISGYAGKYQISTFGRVKSLRNKKHIIMRQYDCNEYLKIDLYDNWVRKKAFVHILVATSFVNNVSNKSEVNHKKGDKKYNFYKQLEWNTSSENTNHAYLELNCKRRGKGLSNVNGVLQLSVKGEIIKEWPTLYDITQSFGWSWSCISRCCRGVIKTSYGYKWKYK